MAWVIGKGRTSPSAAFTVSKDGRPYDLTGATIVQFRARRVGDPSSVVVIDTLLTVVGDPTLGQVRWDPTSAETNIAPGDFLGWAYVKDATGADFDTPEFVWAISAHADVAISVFASADEILSRAGGLLDGLSSVTAVTPDDLVGYLSECSALIDGALNGYGVVTPITDHAAREALSGLACDGALVLALKARYPTAGTRLTPLLDAQTRWDDGMAALSAGTHPAIQALVASEGDLSPAMAHDFWADEGGVYYVPDALYPLLRRGVPFNPNTQPSIYQGMHF